MHFKLFQFVVKGIRKKVKKMIVSSLNNFQIFKIFVNFALLCVFKSSMFQNIIHKIFSVKFQVNSQNFK